MIENFLSCVHRVLEGMVERFCINLLATLKTKYLQYFETAVETFSKPQRLLHPKHPLH